MPRLGRPPQVAVVGSRDYPRTHGAIPLVEQAVKRLATLDPTTVIISGGARGVDSIAKRAAESAGLKVLVFPAQWHDSKGLYHGDAGFKRNQIIVNHCDSVLVFWDGKSRGAADTACRAHKAKKRVVAIGPDGQPCWDTLWGKMKAWGWVNDDDR